MTLPTFDPLFQVPHTPCEHMTAENGPGFVGGCENCHRDEYVSEIVRLHRAFCDIAADLYVAGGNYPIIRQIADRSRRIGLALDKPDRRDPMEPLPLPTEARP